MRSSALTMLATVVLAIARAGTAAAQSAPPPPDPAESDESDDSDVPATAPAPDLPPISERRLSRRDEAPEAPARKTGDGASILAGLELGVGGVVGGGSDVFGAGLGRGFLIGVRWRRTSIEWHFAEVYDAPVDKDLVASNTAGQVSISSLGVRIEPAPFLSVYGGMAKASVPLLVRDSDTIVRSAALDGIGPIGGVAVGWSLGSMTIGVELRLAKLVITDATPAHLTVTGPRDASGMIPVTTDHTSLRPTIATLTATVRLTED